MAKTDKIVELIKYYKNQIEEYEELLEDSLEDGETNSIRETYVDIYTEFVKDLEKLKEYYNEK